MWNGPLEQINEYTFRIPQNYKSGMRVEGRLYAGERLLADIRQDRAPEQVANVACLPGIVGASLAMPDIHWGYGFPIGGVAATDPEDDGVIAPGGIGYDINCGVRFLRTTLMKEEVTSSISALADALSQMIPSGVGSKGKVRISGKEEKKLLAQGARWAVRQGMGVEHDLEMCEEHGGFQDADPDVVSERAYARGKPQSGTLGSGNHFLEVQVVDEIYDLQAAAVMGISPGQIGVMIHTGSRGFGYQVCADSLKVMAQCVVKYRLDLPDRQLACAPLNSPEARRYLGAMRCAANYAWANRQVLTHLTREGFEKIFGQGWSKMGMNLVYDVAHNIAKMETHLIQGQKKTLCVHRKGATRAFGPGNPEIPERYRDIGQPVIIPGDMGRVSFLLAGTKKAEQETFGSTCHGAGRLKSRKEATRTVQLSRLMSDLKQKNIEVRAAGKATLVEEAPAAYKDVNDVVNVVHQAGIARKVARLRPLCVVKG
ncbi:MAG: RNA-splicing ligase RtcB [Candidatus Omnitrophica bacterium]|nr:RNA-splicing ligase RtcB [Candidatus Omnitrophota bacterium]